MTEIPYTERLAPGPGRYRVLYANGEWQVPKSERPADWREREKPKPYRDSGPRLNYAPKLAKRAKEGA